MFACSVSYPQDPITLTRFILKEQQEVRAAGGHVTGSFAMLLQSIQLAVKVIANASTKAGIANLYGVAGSENKSGDQQKKLDVFSNDVFINAIKFSEQVAPFTFLPLPSSPFTSAPCLPLQVYVMCSEENEEAIVCDKNSGGYAVVFDPLDGSSNIDANVSVGTIFGIYARDPTHGETSDRDLLKKGSKFICGGYALYGSCVMLVLTTGRGVNGFSLDPSLGEFILTHKNIRIPLDGKQRPLPSAIHAMLCGTRVQTIRMAFFFLRLGSCRKNLLSQRGQL